MAFVDLEDAAMLHTAKRVIRWMHDERIRGDALAPEESPEARLRPWFEAVGYDEARIQLELAKARNRFKQRIAFAPGERATEAMTASPESPSHPHASTGIELVMGWNIHGDARWGYAGHCPTCHRQVSNLHLRGGPLMLAAAKLESDPRSPLVCVDCGAESPLRSWSFDPTLLVSPLALRFANWRPLRTSFLEALATVVGGRVRTTSEVL
ncbi:hypothetical protein [Labilithrix luteola]|uniref:hypothetical protein n=1 Tax=Labilithrix luteola TaxID=1391654 RepID=UPI0011BAB16E|nr:hypothetical protein [Labilithrix luteola]